MINVLGWADDGHQYILQGAMRMCEFVLAPRKP